MVSVKLFKSTIVGFFSSEDLEEGEDYRVLSDDSGALIVIIPDYAIISVTKLRRVGKVMALILKLAFDYKKKVASAKYCRLREMDGYPGWRIRIKN